MPYSSHNERYAAYCEALAEASAMVRAAQAAHDFGSPAEWFRLAEEAARQQSAPDACRNSVPLTAEPPSPAE